ncbi:MAG: DUF669 domain-containing protein [Roseomonas sp.]|nr:DUF669 domain-containing protein [Roseomonas sp.]
MADLSQALGGAFDANNVEPSAPIEVLPPGKYPAQMVKSELAANSKGTGYNLNLEFEIIDGPAQGRKLWDSLSLVNPSAQAVEIAQRNLSAICHAVGKLQVSDSEELHFKPLLVTVKMIPKGTVEKNGFEHKRDKNEVEGYSALAGAQPAPRPVAQASPPMQARPAPAASPPPPAVRGAMANAPWRRTA